MFIGFANVCERQFGKLQRARARVQPMDIIFISAFPNLVEKRSALIASALHPSLQTLKPPYKTSDPLSDRFA